MRANTVLLSLLLALLMPPGCFNPEYGYGGFLCGKGSCPEGYGCVCSNGKNTCFKGKGDKPCAGPDGKVTQHDGGGTKAPLNCTAPAKITSDVLLPADLKRSVGTFDLVLDHADTPSMVWVTKNGDVKIVAKAQGSPWPTDGQALGKTGITTVAAAANNKKHIHVIYPDKSSTSTQKALWHAYFDMEQKPPKWTTAVDIVQMEVADVSLGADPRLSPEVYLAAAEKAGSGQPARKLVGRIHHDGSAYKYTDVCNNTTTHTYSTPRITLGKGSGVKPGVAFSFHDTKKPGWELGTLSAGNTSCPDIYSLTGVAQPSPAALTWDGLGGLQIAWGEADKSKRANGPLNSVTWEPTSGINTSNIYKVSANTITDPQSVSLSIRGIAPCIAT